MGGADYIADYASEQLSSMGLEKVSSREDGELIWQTRILFISLSGNFHYFRNVQADTNFG